MTKMNYIAAVKLLTEHGWNAEKAIVDLFSEFFAEDNPRFDRNKFESACKGKAK